jgi:hypothetical protein
MEAGGSGWKRMEADGSGWKRMEADGSGWKRMEADGRKHRWHVGFRANNHWNPTYLVQTGQNGLSSIQNILRCNLSLPFAHAWRKIFLTTN